MGIILRWKFYQYHGWVHLDGLVSGCLTNPLPYPSFWHRFVSRGKFLWDHACISVREPLGHIIRRHQTATKRWTWPKMVTNIFTNMRSKNRKKKTRKVAFITFRQFYWLRLVEWTHGKEWLPIYYSFSCKNAYFSWSRQRTWSFTCNYWFRSLKKKRRRRIERNLLAFQAL